MLLDTIRDFLQRQGIVQLEQPSLSYPRSSIRALYTSARIDSNPSSGGEAIRQPVVHSLRRGIEGGVRRVNGNVELRGTHQRAVARIRLRQRVERMEDQRVIRNYQL